MYISGNICTSGLAFVGDMAPFSQLFCDADIIRICLEREKLKFYCTSFESYCFEELQ